MVHVSTWNHLSIQPQKLLPKPHTIGTNTKERAKGGKKNTLFRLQPYAGKKIITIFAHN